MREMAMEETKENISREQDEGGCKGKARGRPAQDQSKTTARGRGRPREGREKNKSETTHGKTRERHTPSLTPALRYAASDTVAVRCLPSGRSVLPFLILKVCAKRPSTRLRAGSVPLSWRPRPVAWSRQTTPSVKRRPFAPAQRLRLPQLT